MIIFIVIVFTSFLSFPLVHYYYILHLGSQSVTDIFIIIFSLTFLTVFNLYFLHTVFCKFLLLSFLCFIYLFFFSLSSLFLCSPRYDPFLYILAHSCSPLAPLFLSLLFLLLLFTFIHLFSRAMSSALLHLPCPPLTLPANLPRTHFSSPPPSSPCSHLK